MLLFLFALGLLGLAQMAEPPDAFGRYCQIDRGRIYYEVEGQGRPVILIHDWMDSSSYWRDIFFCFSKKRKIFTIDLLGYGKSDKPDGAGYGISDLEKDLDRFLDTMLVKKVDLIGHSMGGTLALQYSLLHSNRINRLVLVSSPFYPRPPPIFFRIFSIPFVGKALFWLSWRPFIHLQWRKAFFDNNRINKSFLEDLKSLPYGVMLSSLRSIHEIDLRPKLKEIKIPTLIIWGKEDRLLPYSVATELNREIKGSRLAVLERTGHFPMVETSDRFCQEVLNFFETNPVNAHLPGEKNKEGQGAK